MIEDTDLTMGEDEEVVVEVLEVEVSVVEVALEVGVVAEEEEAVAVVEDQCQQMVPTLCTWATCPTAWSKETWNSSLKISRCVRTCKIWRVPFLGNNAELADYTKLSSVFKV